MVHDRERWRLGTLCAAGVLSAALLPLIALGPSAVQAQGMMRTPNLNVGARGFSSIRFVEVRRFGAALGHYGNSLVRYINFCFYI